MILTIEMKLLLKPRTTKNTYLRIFVDKIRRRYRANSSTDAHR